MAKRTNAPIEVVEHELANLASIEPDVDENSTAHQGKGQSVLYKDGSREWRDEVDYGIGGDNIYTYGGDHLRDGGTPDGDSPVGNGDGGPYGKKDSYLVSEQNF